MTSVALPKGRDGAVVDTRTPSPSPSHSSANGGDAYKPDLSKEVSMLSTKLINAINYQTNLDDSLQSTRHQLEKAQQELQKVRAEKQSLTDAVTQGVLVKKSEVDVTIAEIRAELAQEKEKRENAERVKRQTESEVETLTGSLFEEANKMVAEARRETEAAEKRTSQVRAQLSDTEMLLASQQEQLQDLKSTMEALERSATNIAAQRDASMPSTPVNRHSGAFDVPLTGPVVDQADVPPNHPLYFSHLIQPVMRNDVAAYNDFAELISTAKKVAPPHSRSASGNMATSSSSTNLHANPNSTSAANTSSPSLPGSFTFSNSSSPSASAYQAPVPALKDTKFYKRVLLEDLEPTLRLDLAPGLSFLSRRSVLSALLNGTLFVEPLAPSSTWKLYAPVFPCSLCSESRKTEPYIRRHTFRTSESDDSSRYPLCDFCLGRVRAAGDFVGFLRMVRDGVWRAEGEAGEKGAWEEAVRLRERMFWARIGGGVVPAASLALNAGKSTLTNATANPSDDTPEQQKAEGEQAAVFRERKGSIDEPEVLQAQVKELKRRTMLHLGDSSPAVSILAKDPDATPPPSASSQGTDDEQTDASAQLQREAAGAPLMPTPSSEDEGMVSAEEGPPSPTPPPVPEHKSIPSKERTGSDASTASTSTTLAAARTRPSNDERRGSSVLDRVKAMESRG